MKHFRLLAFCLSALWINAIHAQDIHYTLFNMSPLTLNPALTGAYEGTARIGGIYRDQWANVVSNSFTTPGVYLDAPIIRGFGKKDWVGVGAINVNDEAGRFYLQTNISGLSLAYHAGLGNNSVLTLGLQGAMVQRRVDTQSGFLRFEDSYDISTGGFTSASTDLTNIRENVNYTDINAGLMLRTKLPGKRTLELGFSAAHINAPRYSMVNTTGFNDDGTRRPLRLAAHGSFFTPLKNEKWSLSPTFLVQTTAGAFEGIGQAWAGYEVKKDVRVNFGAGYRVGDALQVLVGLDYEDLKVAASYDMNVSSLAAVSKTVGGFEISAWYILKMYKKPDVKPIIFCPHF